MQVSNSTGWDYSPKRYLPLVAANPMFEFPWWPNKAMLKLILADDRLGVILIVKKKEKKKKKHKSPLGNDRSSEFQSILKFR